ncbi:MAG: hypothetical protein ABI367_05410 [Mucilaginibacter sp.]
MNQGLADNEAMRILRHDIKNQLSNISLLVAELKYEITNPTPDCVTYLDMIDRSVSAIDTMLKNTQQQ